eukprot:COSAG01_NODE_3948_length_5502_cov_199.757542_2_plen_193_part_00
MLYLTTCPQAVGSATSTTTRVVAKVGDKTIKIGTLGAVDLSKESRKEAARQKLEAAKAKKEAKKVLSVAVMRNVERSQCVCLPMQNGDSKGILGSSLSAVKGATQATTGTVKAAAKAADTVGSVVAGASGRQDSKHGPSKKGSKKGKKQSSAGHKKGAKEDKKDSKQNAKQDAKQQKKVRCRFSVPTSQPQR